MCRAASLGLGTVDTQQRRCFLFPQSAGRLILEPSLKLSEPRLGRSLQIDPEPLQDDRQTHVSPRGAGSWSWVGVLQAEGLLGQP